MSYFYICYNIVENGMVVFVEIIFYLMDMESREKENMILCICLSILVLLVE